MLLPEFFPLWWAWQLTFTEHSPQDKLWTCYFDNIFFHLQKNPVRQSLLPYFIINEGILMQFRPSKSMNSMEPVRCHPPPAVLPSDWCLVSILFHSQNITKFISQRAKVHTWICLHTPWLYVPIQIQTGNDIAHAWEFTEYQLIICYHSGQSTPRLHLPWTALYQEEAAQEASAHIAHNSVHKHMM